jgi:hypothetical protein
MLKEANELRFGGHTVPEIEVIKEIILRDMRSAHEARMTEIQAYLARLEAVFDSRLSALKQEIDTLAIKSERSQKQALSELGSAISEIAGRFRLEQKALQDVEQE